MAGGYSPLINSLILSGEDIYGILPYGGSKGDGVVFSFRDVELGVDNIRADESGITIYPNPSNGIFTASIKNHEAGIANVEVYNIIGENVFNSKLATQNAQFSINLSGQPEGIYLYRVIANNGELIGEGKLVIQK
jgi:hypothetical protein